MIKENIALELIDTLHYFVAAVYALRFSCLYLYSKLLAMGSIYTEMITSEISFLEEEIQRLKIELNSARHSTLLVGRHAGKKKLNTANSLLHHND